MPVKGTYEKLRVLLPSVKLVQVIHVMDERSVETAISISGEVDALLLDSGNPTLKIKELGGTGRVHNWKLSREISKNSRCPVFLAGGLNPQNVRQAIEEVDPFGIDVCSGVRTGGALDRSKLSEFMANIISTRG
jgi:phosphoribosylanthranilate isomerase